MRCAFLVAWREYAENAKTKGFWIGILLLPVIIFMSIQAPLWLERKATPVRYFVLVDQSGSYGPAVESALERSHQQRVLDALNEYARKNSNPPPSRSPAGAPRTERLNDPNAQPKPGVPLHQSDPAGSHSVEDFIAKGGKAFFLEQLKPRLKPGTPAFTEPRRPFQSVKVSAWINAEADLASLADDLRPYLRGEKKIEAAGQQVELSAAVLIPPEIEIVRPQTDHTTRNTNAPSPDIQQPASSIQQPASTIQFWSANASDPKLREEIERAVNTEIRRREYLARGLDRAAIRQVENTYAAFANLNPKKEKGREAASPSDTIKQWAPSGFVYLL